MANFYITNKNHAIKYIKVSNTAIKSLQKIEIKLIGRKNTFKANHKLVLLVIEFFTLEYTNADLDYNILIGQEVYAEMVFNRARKSM